MIKKINPKQIDLEDHKIGEYALAIQETITNDESPATSTNSQLLDLMRTNEQLTGAYNTNLGDDDGNGNWNEGNLSIVGNGSMLNFYQEECKSNQ